MNKCIAVSVMLMVIGVSLQASALEIRVRGESQLNVTLDAAGTVAQVAGRLVDENEKGIGHRTVEIRIESVESASEVAFLEVVTSPLGRFQAFEELKPGEYAVYVRYPKNEHFDGVEALGTIRLTPAPVELDLFGPELAVSREQAIHVYGSARSQGRPYQGEARVMVNGESVGVLGFDPAGRGSFDVSTWLVQGDNEVAIVVEGSEFRDRARASSTVRYSEGLDVSATMNEKVERLTRGLAIAGRVEDSAGPLPGVRVQARFSPQFETDRPSVSLSEVTDSQGRFSVFAPDHRLGEGNWSGIARAIPPVGPASEVRVDPLNVDRTATRWFLNVFGIVAVGLGFLVLLSHGWRALWLKINAWRERRAQAERRHKAMEARETIVPVFLEDPETEHKDRSFDVGGVIWDIWNGHAIRDASITIASSGAEFEAASDAAGRFTIGELPAGSYEISVTAHGFVRGTMPLSVPHDGRFRHFRVDLVAVPLKIRRLYQAILESRTGHDPWGKLSPREIEEILQTLFLGDEMPPVADGMRDRRIARVEELLETYGDADDESVSVEELIHVVTTVIEQSYFSGRVYDEAFWLLVRDVLLQLQDMRPAGQRRARD